MSLRIKNVVLRTLLLFTLMTFSGLFFLFLFLRQDPSRPWAKEQSELPWSETSGQILKLHNLRNNSYRTEKIFDLQYESRSYDLSKLQRLWFLVIPFAEWRGPAHTFLSFEFENGNYLAISVEARKKEGEAYSPYRGLLRYFPLIYVAGDERDLILLRTNFQKDPVYLYPVRATPEKIRELFLDVTQRMNQLRDKPEYYNTLFNSCTSNIVSHVNKLLTKDIPWAYQVFLPGYSDELAHDLGLLDTDLSLVEAREKYLITKKAQELGAVKDFSNRIRADF